MTSQHRHRGSREEALAIKSEVDYQRLNKSFTDVTFIVGPPQHSKKYVGHRVLLAMTSPVFETLFYGDMADKNKMIRIPDVAPIGFENLLRYAYTDSLNLNSVEDAMLTAYAAKKYLLPQLLRECLNYIEKNIAPSSACAVYEFAQVLNSHQLMLQAINLIDRQTYSVVTHKSFNSVQPTTVEFIVNRKYLNIYSEYSLFNSAISWALNESKRRSCNVGDWQVIRAILTEAEILKSIRFLAMTSEEFAKAIALTSNNESAAAIEATTVKKSNHSKSHSSSSQTIKAKQQNGGAIDGNEDEKTASGKTTKGSSGDSGGELATEHGVGNVGTLGNKEEERDKEINVPAVSIDDDNCLLNKSEQLAIFMNLAVAGLARIPATLSENSAPRCAPPDYFTIRRYKPSPHSMSTATTRTIKSITSKFQCLNQNVFIVAITIPLRLDQSNFAARTPKFECHLKYITKSTIDGGYLNANHHHHSSDNHSGSGDDTLLMDTIDESIQLSISKEKDCLIKLKRPIMVRMNNINEMILTFQPTALDEDIVILRGPKIRSGNFSEIVDSENISWLFFRTNNTEFSELHYYY